MFGFLWKKGVCPECRTRGARLFLGRVKCRNASCQYYDLETGQELPPPPPPQIPPMEGGLEKNAVMVHYVNFRGEERRYAADRTSFQKKGAHITGRLIEPTGKRVAFARKWIKNVEEIDRLVAQAAEVGNIWRSLTPVERQIVGYHRKMKSTSARYEEILRKYPGLAEK